MRYPLVVVTAPVGYGKTMVAKELLQTRFALCQGPPLNKKNGPADLNKPNQPFNLGVRSKVIEKIKEVTARFPILLIVDDFHHLQDEGYHRFFLRLVNASIPGLSVLLLSRSRAKLPLEEMIIKGQCRHFGPDLLAFDLAETEQFFRCQGICSSELIEQCWRESEGWIAALRLAAEKHANNDKGVIGAGLPGLFQYSVLNGFNRQDNLLLFTLSLLDRFTEDQAAHLTGDKNVKLLLRRLAADHMFLSCDQKSGEYRFHRLFRAFCHAQFEMTPSELLDHKAIMARLPKRPHLDADQFFQLGSSLQEKKALPGSVPTPEHSHIGPENGSPTFTAREKQIIHELLKGLNNRQIADHFSIQRVTVAKALGNVYRKLGVKNRAQAIGALLSRQVDLRASKQ